MLPSVCPDCRNPLPPVPGALCRNCHRFFAGPRRLPLPIAFGFSGIVFGALSGVLHLERRFAEDQVVLDLGFYLSYIGESAIVLGFVGVLLGIVAELGLRAVGMPTGRVERRRLRVRKNASPADSSLGQQSAATLPPQDPSDPLPD